MSTTAQFGALVSGLVWLGVLLLLVLVWVDDRRRENEELFANSRPARLGRAGAPGYAPAPRPEADPLPVEEFAAPPEPEVRNDPFPAPSPSGPPSLWQIHKPLSQPRTEPDPPNGADAARPAAAGDGS